jgi:biotin synthase-like enzyme
MATLRGSLCLPLILLLVLPLQSFALQVLLPASVRGDVSHLRVFQLHANQHNDNDDDNDDDNVITTRNLSRRSAISHHATKSLVSSTAAITTLTGLPNSAMAAVGSLPELSDANAILQGITINSLSDSQ